MAYTVTQYREETVAAFEQNYSLLKACCTRETVIKGNSAVFLVAGSGGLSAVTRGVNGLIPYQTPDKTQYTATLEEEHAPYEMTDFDIFQAQGNMRKVMQDASVAVMNRSIDAKIITQLDTATLTTGAAATASVSMVNKAVAVLGNNEVDITDEDNMFGVITPGFRAYLMETSEFSSGDYVEMKPYGTKARRMFRWNSINWMVHPNLTGVGTSSEKCYIFHRNAIGHAANAADMSVEMDYDKKQHSSWSRATYYHGAKMLQTTGVVQMLHDGSAFTGS